MNKIQTINSEIDIPDGTRKVTLQELINFAPFDYQVPAFDFITKGYFEKGKKGGYLTDNAGNKYAKQIYTVWHRRAGKDLLGLICMIIAMHYTPNGRFYHLFPEEEQGRRAVWGGSTLSEASEATRTYIDFFPKELIANTVTSDGEVQYKISQKNAKIEFKNGATYEIIGTKDPERLRGLGASGVLVSEYASFSPRQAEGCKAVLIPVINDSKGWIWYNTTPNPAHPKNHAYNDFVHLQGLERKYKETGDVMNIFTQRLTIKDTKRYSEREVDRLAEESNMSEQQKQTEYYCSWEVKSLGNHYYKDTLDEIKKKGQITQVLHDPALPVYTAWDLGNNNTKTTGWFFQMKAGIVYYLGTHENATGTDSLVKELQLKPYNYGGHFFPHDVNRTSVRDATTTTIQSMENLGLRNVHKIPRRPNGRLREYLEGSIAHLNISYFDSSMCQRGIIALYNYRSETDKRKTGYGQPVKDREYSELIDAYQYSTRAVALVHDMTERHLYEAENGEDNYAIAPESFY